MWDGYWLPPRSVCHPRCRHRPPRIPCVSPGASALRSGGRSVDLRGWLWCGQGLKKGGESTDVHGCFFVCFCVRFVYNNVCVHYKLEMSKCPMQIIGFELNYLRHSVSLWWSHGRKRIWKLSADLTMSHYHLRTMKDMASGCIRLLLACIKHTHIYIYN